MANWVAEKIAGRAAGSGRRIALPEPDDARVLAAARRIVDRGLSQVVLAGDRRIDGMVAGNICPTRVSDARRPTRPSPAGPTP